VPEVINHIEHESPAVRVALRVFVQLRFLALNHGSTDRVHNLTLVFHILTVLILRPSNSFHLFFTVLARPVLVEVRLVGYGPFARELILGKGLTAHARLVFGFPHLLCRFLILLVYSLHG